MSAEPRELPRAWRKTEVLSAIMVSRPGRRWWDRSAVLGRSRWNWRSGGPRRRRAASGRPANRLCRVGHGSPKGLHCVGAAPYATMRLSGAETVGALRTAVLWHSRASAGQLSRQASSGPAGAIDLYGHTLLHLGDRVQPRHRRLANRWRRLRDQYIPCPLTSRAPPQYLHVTPTLPMSARQSL